MKDNIICGHLACTQQEAGLTAMPNMDRPKTPFPRLSLPPLEPTMPVFPLPAGTDSPESPMPRPLSPFLEPPKKKPGTSIWRLLGTLVDDSARQAWQDLRVARWPSFGLDALYFVLVALVIASIILTILTSGANPFQTSSACQLNGDFPRYEKPPDPLATSAFFDITIALGDFDSSGVNSLDIAWQIVRLTHFTTLRTIYLSRHLP